MAQREFDNTNTGALWNKQLEKREGKKDPDYRGRININGVEGWLSGWINVSRKGEKFLSLKVTPMESHRVAGNGAAAGDEFEGLGF